MIFRAPGNFRALDNFRAPGNFRAQHSTILRFYLPISRHTQNYLSILEVHMMMPHLNIALIRVGLGRFELPTS